MTKARAREAAWGFWLPGRRCWSGPHPAQSALHWLRAKPPKRAQPESARCVPELSWRTLLCHLPCAASRLVRLAARCRLLVASLHYTDSTCTNTERHDVHRRRKLSNPKRATPISLEHLTLLVCLGSSDNGKSKCTNVSAMQRATNGDERSTDGSHQPILRPH